MKTPQFITLAVDAVRKGSLALWMQGPWRVVRPLHEAGEKMAGLALHACRERWPQYYLQGTRASGMASFLAAMTAGSQMINMCALCCAATTVTAAALPAVAGVAAAAALAVAVGGLRKSSRCAEKYFLYERDLDALCGLPVPEVAPAPLPKPRKALFNRKADITTGEAVTPMKALKLKPPADNTGAAP